MKKKAKNSYKFEPENITIKKLYERYPFDGKIISKVFFHVIDPDLSDDQLDDLYDKVDEYLDEREMANNPDYTVDEIDDDEYEEYIDPESDEFEEMEIEYDARDDYASIVIEYLKTEGCDTAFVYSFIMKSADGEDINELIQSDYCINVIIGVKYYNNIDIKIEEECGGDIRLIEYIREIRQSSNQDILYQAGQCSTIVETLLNCIMFDVLRFIISSHKYDSHVELTLEDITQNPKFSECTEAPIYKVDDSIIDMYLCSYETDISKIGRFKRIEGFVQDTIEMVYYKVLQVLNAKAILEQSSKVVYKYHNDEKECEFYSNGVIGGTYIFEKGFNLE